MLFELGVIALGILIFLLALLWVFKGLIRKGTVLTSQSSTDTTSISQKSWLRRNWKKLLLVLLLLWVVWTVWTWQPWGHFSSPEKESDIIESLPTNTSAYPKTWDTSSPAHYSRWDGYTQGPVFVEGGSAAWIQKNATEQKKYVLYFPLNGTAIRLRGGYWEQFHGLYGSWIVADLSGFHRFEADWEPSSQVYVTANTTDELSKTSSVNTRLADANQKLTVVSGEDGVSILSNGNLLASSKTSARNSKMLIRFFIPEGEEVWMKNIQAN